jgi:MYXO-CTERM domain-containing protein
MKARVTLAALLLAGAVPSVARATAKFTIQVTDTAGVGFKDTTPATPVAGNSGTTVGQQRLNVFQAAADAWGRILESTVPIVVDASFAPLECSGGMAVEGQAAPFSVQNIAGLPSKGDYPKALANKILGKDVYPGEADITAQFNGGLYDCIGTDWYYGLDGNAAGDEANLLTTVIHELGHGLGFTDDVDPTTGVFYMGSAPTFATFMLDNKTSKHLSAMTNAERKAAYADVRQLVWDGPRTKEVAARFLTKGSPSIQVTPAVSGFSGAIGEANFGPALSSGSAITGGLVTGTLASDCKTVTGTFTGKVVLIISPSTRCASITAAYGVQKGGGLAMLFAYNDTSSPPPVALEFRNSDIASYPAITIPTLAVTISDADLLKSAAGATVTLSADTAKVVGADAAGNTYLFASNPIQPGSTGSHWDPLVRPNLIMEPVDQPNPVMYLDMERAVMWDIGWTGTCGNGTVDGQEGCDDGASNSDYLPNACRLDCTKSRCGDGVVDTGEQCDPGGNGKLGDLNCNASCELKSGTTGTGGKGAGGTGGSGTGGSSGKADAGSSGAGGTGAGGAGAGGTIVTESGGASGTGGRGQTGGTNAAGGSAGSGSGSGGSAGSGSHGGAGGTSSGTSTGAKSSGCGCHVGGSERAPTSALLFLVAVSLAFAGRRRPRR